MNGTLSFTLNSIADTAHTTVCLLSCENAIEQYDLVVKLAAKFIHASLLRNDEPDSLDNPFLQFCIIFNCSCADDAVQLITIV